MIIEQIFFGVLILCSFLCLYRIGSGPTVSDRVVGIDVLGTVVIGFCALLSIMTESDFYINIALAWIMIYFLGTLALAKHMEGKYFDE